MADEVLHQIEEHGFGCKRLMDDGRDDDSHDIGICQQPMMFDVIQAHREVNEHLPVVPKFWLTGCLFGYSQLDIESAWRAT